MHSNSDPRYRPETSKTQPWCPSQHPKTAKILALNSIWVANSLTEVHPFPVISAHAAVADPSIGRSGLTLRAGCLIRNYGVLRVALTCVVQT